MSEEGAVDVDLCDLVPVLNNCVSPEEHSHTVRLMLSVCALHPPPPLVTSDASSTMRQTYSFHILHRSLARAKRNLRAAAFKFCLNTGHIPASAGTPRQNCGKTVSVGRFLVFGEDVLWFCFQNSWLRGSLVNSDYCCLLRDLSGTAARLEVLVEAAVDGDDDDEEEYERPKPAAAAKPISVLDSPPPSVGPVPS